LRIEDSLQLAAGSFNLNNSSLTPNVHKRSISKRKT
jgi:hypothetical protein